MHRRAYNINHVRPNAGQKTHFAEAYEGGGFNRKLAHSQRLGCAVRTAEVLFLSAQPLGQLPARFLLRLAVAPLKLPLRSAQTLLLHPLRPLRRQRPHLHILHKLPPRELDFGLERAHPHPRHHQLHVQLVTCLWMLQGLRGGASPHGPVKFAV